MPMVFEQECYAIRGAIYEVYSILGSGFAEDVYQEALEAELGDRSIPFVSHPRLRIRYKEKILEKVYIPDVLCYDKVILELKAVKALLPEHDAQLINYLKATSLSLGMLINFGTYPRADIRTLTRRADYNPLPEETH